MIQYIKPFRRKVSCVYNTIIKMSFNIFSISYESIFPSFTLFCFIERLFLRNTFLFSLVDLFQRYTVKSLLNDSHVSLGFVFAIVYKKDYVEFIADQSPMPLSIFRLFCFLFVIQKRIPVPCFIQIELQKR